MPSPVGHALGGLLFGWLAGGAPAPSPDQSGGPPAEEPTRRAWGAVRRVLLHPWTIGFAVLGALADVDFALGIHSQQTHSIGAAALVFAVAAGWGGRLDLRRGLACGLAYGSHVLLDWMGNDTTAPIGIMALWPFSDAFYQSELYVFDAISRRYWLPNFWTHNLLAVLREVVILAPLAAIAYRIRPLPRAAAPRAVPVRE